MRFKNLQIVIVLCSLSGLLISCGAKSDKNAYRSTDAYDIANPKIINLPASIEEISGIAYYPKDTSVFAIIDEDGILFKISLNDPKKIKEWRFGKRRDYEDVILKDSIFYVLVSNGDVEKLKFNGDSINVEQYQFPDASKKTNEFESLYYDPATDKKIILCKDCEDDKKGNISSFALVDSAMGYENYAAINTQAIFDKLGRREKIKPSAAAVNPVTKELYILCSVNKLLVIQDAQGNLKDVIELNPKIYKQPEGIAFTPAGDLIISNEYYLEGDGTLLLLKNKKPH